MKQYRVSKYYNEIRKVERNDDSFASSIANHSLYVWFNTYDEAKQFCIDRVKDEIESLEIRLKNLKKKIPQLEKMTEKVS